MADITCCSSATCYGLLTVGYMESLIPQGHCYNMTLHGIPRTDSCCDAPSSSYAVSYASANTVTKRYKDDSDPNNDKSGFVFAAPLVRNSDCCPQNSGNTILKESDATFEYTVAVNNALSPITVPSVCDTSYNVTETKTYTIYRKGCNIDDSYTFSKDVTHNQDSDGSIEKIFNGSDTEWNVTFSPSTKTISGLTIDDCGHSSSDSVTWNFPEYTVGYNLMGGAWGKYCGTSTKVPCKGDTFEFVYSANTSCPSDFNITLDVKSNNKSIIDDPTADTSISINSTSSSISIGEDGRTAEIEITHVTITFGQNISAKPNGEIIISISANNASITESYSCKFDRQPCAWNAGSVTDPENCSAYWPTVNWENLEAEIKEVVQVGPNCNNR